MEYMIDPTARSICGIFFMRSLSKSVLGDIFLEIIIPWLEGMSSPLLFSMLNLFSTVSMYLAYDRPSILLDLSL